MRHHYRLTWINKYFRDESRDPNSIHFMYDQIITQNQFFHSDHLVNKGFLMEVLILAVVPIPNYDKYINITTNDGVKVVYLLSDF